MTSGNAGSIGGGERKLSQKSRFSQRGSRRRGAVLGDESLLSMDNFVNFGILGTS